MRAVAGASLTVERGQIIGLVGESGCGKSTLARVGVGLVAPSAGQVLFEGQPLTPLGRAARPAREARLQMVFQNPYASLNPRRRIGTQIRAAMTLAGREGDRDARVAELLEQVGLSPGAARRYPHEFSAASASASRSPARSRPTPRASCSTSRSRRSTPPRRRRSRTCSCGSRASSTSACC